MVFVVNRFSYVLFTSIYNLLTTELTEINLAKQKFQTLKTLEALVCFVLSDNGSKSIMQYLVSNSDG